MSELGIFKKSSSFQFLFFYRKSEAMNRPRKEFVPTSLSDLNIDAISLSSNGDRHNNNSNGARFNNLNRSASKSSYNLASYQKPSLHNSSDHFSRSKQFYGSQSNINNKQNVNNFNIDSPSVGVDRWEQAWEDNNNHYRQPQRQAEPSFEKSNPLDFKSSQTTSNRSVNHYVDDPFDDPWSGISSCSFNHFCSLHKCKTCFIITLQ